jgi:hypothetical protein
MIFLFIPDNMYDEVIDKGILNKAGNSICTTLLNCFLSTLNYGLRAREDRGGIGGAIPIADNKDWNL